MLRTKLEIVSGFLLVLLSIITSAILPIFGRIFFSAEDRKKLKVNQDLIAKKESQRHEQFQAIENKFTLNGKRQKILKLSGVNLINALQTRSLSATEVLEAYIAKAIQVTRKCNCITEFIPQALEWAAELDSLEQIKGPLHGVPVSIKEHTNIVGSDSTMGFAQFLFQPAEEDAAIVEALKDLGAVIFCKTNIPQSLFTYGCGNDVYGETLNPLNLKLSPGGSSGGCAALIAGGGTVLGVGTDVGGSIRIPSHFCGIVGMKPTVPRMTMQGYRNSGAVMIPITGTNGFMAKNMETLVYAYKSLFESGLLSELDPNAVPIPWNEKMFNPKRKLKFGYFTNNSYFPMIGDAEPVTIDAIDKLKAQGYEAVPFHMPDVDALMDLIWNFAFADLGESFRHIWKGESIAETAIGAYWLSRLPLWFRNILAYLAEFQLGPVKMPIFYSPLMAKILRGGSKTWKTNMLWKKVVERKVLQNYIKSQWLANNIDVLICPAFPFPALPHAMPGKLLQAVATTMPWNLMDFPAGTVPFGKESGKYLDQYDHRDDFLLRMALKATRQSVGMPISVQIVGLPFQEEKVLHAMSIVEQLRQ